MAARDSPPLRMLEDALTRAVCESIHSQERQKVEGKLNPQDLIASVGRSLLASVGVEEHTSTQAGELVHVERRPSTGGTDDARLENLRGAYLKQLQAEADRLRKPAQSLSLIKLDQTKLAPELMHLTGLIDSADIPTLRMALLDAAGNPPHDQRPLSVSDLSTWSNDNLKALSTETLVSLQLHVPRKAVHIAGSVDTADGQNLRLALFDSAGNPSHDGRDPFSPYQFSTWSRENLAALDKDKLALLCERARKFTAPINMPFGILSLHGDTKFGGEIFSSYLFPFDKHAMSSSGKSLTNLVLASGIFSDGTPLNDLAKLSALRRCIFGSGSNSPTYTLLSSPLNSITLPDAARARASIPPSGAFYSFCHAAASAEAAAEALSSIDNLNQSDPLVAFLLNGAYLYFDHTYDIVAVNALSFVGSGGSAIFLGPPCPFPATAIEPLFDHERFLPLPHKLASANLGFSKMAWVLPSEFIGGTIFTQSGGFAFIHEDDYKGTDIDGNGLFDIVTTTGARKSRFFPIVRNDPLVKHPYVMEKTASDKPTALTIRRADLDGWPVEDALDAVRHFAENVPTIKPLPHCSPLYIPELTQGHKSSVSKLLGGVNNLKFMDPPSAKTVNTAIFAEGKMAALGLDDALGGFDLIELASELGIDEQMISNVATVRECGSNDARWLEVLRAETKRLVVSGEHPSYSLKTLHEYHALWLHDGEKLEDLLEAFCFNVQYILDDAAVEEEVKGNDGHSAFRDKGNGGKTLAVFQAMPQAARAGLSLSEVAGLRLYTSSTFRVINGPLRKRIKPHPLAATTMLISNALKKLRANHMKVDGTKFRGMYLWRGMRDMGINEDFLTQGGSELACMSTSSDLGVVAGYANSASPLIFRIKVDSPMELGAELGWISLFPGESEWLYPPLTFIKPMYMQPIKHMEGGQVVTVKPSFPT